MPNPILCVPNPALCRHFGRSGELTAPFCMLARRKNAESRSVDLLPPACLRVLQENPRESLGGQPRNIVRAVEAMRGPFRVQSQTFVQLHERASFPADRTSVV